MDYNLVDTLVNSYTLEALAWTTIGAAYLLRNKFGNTRKSGIERTIQPEAKSE